MALVLPRSIFLHIPKTGGEWVRAAIHNSAIAVRESNRGLRTAERMHTNLLNTAGLGAWNFAHRGRPWTWYRRGGRFLFSFVRCPLQWHASRWAYKSSEGIWDENDPMDAACYSEDFEQYMWRMIENFPGHASDMFEFYTGRPETGEIDFIGRCESLADDLVRALRLAGEKFDEARIRATPPQNVSGQSPEWKARCRYTPELRAAVLKTEARAVERFGYGDRATQHKEDQPQ